MFLILIVTTIVRLVRSDQEGYTRYNLPFPYKVTVYRSFKSPKSNIEKMQYAPLLLKPPEINDEIYSTVASVAEYSRRNKEGASNLEPRFEQKESHTPYKALLPFVPGYNLQLQQQINPEKENINNEENFKKQSHVPHVLEYNPEHKKASNPIKNNNIQNSIVPISNDQQESNGESRFNRADQNNGDRHPTNLLDLESPSIQPYLVVKAPRLHLNVARAFNFAFIPHKALPHLNEFLLVRKVPSQNEQNFHKTFLASHPIKNKCQTPQH